MGCAFGDPKARAELLQRRDDEYCAAFPLAAYGAWLDGLIDRGTVFLTYEDLFSNSDDHDHEGGYAEEYARWRRDRDGGRVHVLLQHDVDFVPRFTERMMVMEADRGVRSSVFLLRELGPDRPPESPYDDSPYDPDAKFLVGAEEEGFVIGYHQNVAPRCDGTKEGAAKLFEQDVQELRSAFRVEYFCPHGGAGGVIDGASLRNYDIPVPASISPTLRWVYNRYGLRYAARWSDGGLRRATDPTRLDALNLLGAFTESMEPGERYFVLVHPQLWGWRVDQGFNKLLAERPWYGQLLDTFT